VRLQVINHALLFVGGFSSVFIIWFGIPATLLGSLLHSQRNWLAAIGGLLLIVLGMHMTGVPRAAARLTASTTWLRPLGTALVMISGTLDRLILPERRLQSRHSTSSSYVRSFVVGITFAAGWTPCIGPLLGLVLTLATVQPFQAIPLLLAYSAGLAMPFLCAAALLSSTGGLLNRLNRHAHAIEIISGILLIAFGLILVQGSLTALNALFGVIPPWVTQIEANLITDVSEVTLPLAGLAGLLSFLSPCVLPLVPVYLSYLSGMTVICSTGTSK